MTIWKEQHFVSISAQAKSGDYSDLKIVVGKDGEKVYTVHKLVVCPRVQFFANAMRFGGIEASENTIILPEDEPAIIELLLQYLYEGVYKPVLKLDPVTEEMMKDAVERQIDRLREEDAEKNFFSGREPCSFKFPHTCGTFSWSTECTERVCPHHACSSNNGNIHSPDGWCRCMDYTCKTCTTLAEPIDPAAATSPEQLLIHAKMYVIGDKYGVEGLKDLAEKKFEIACEHHWNDDMFAGAVHYACTRTVAEDKGFRNVVLKTIWKHPELITVPEIEDLVADFDPLDVFKTKMQTEKST